MSNFRFFFFVIAFAAFLWFVYQYEPEQNEISTSAQNEPARQQSDDDYRERRSADEIRAMQRERLQSAGRGVPK